VTGTANPLLVRANQLIQLERRNADGKVLEFGGSPKNYRVEIAGTTVRDMPDQAIGAVECEIEGTTLPPVWRDAWT